MRLHQFKYWSPRWEKAYAPRGLWKTRRQQAVVPQVMAALERLVALMEGIHRMCYQPWLAVGLVGIEIREGARVLHFNGRCKPIWNYTPPAAIDSCVTNKCTTPEFHSHGTVVARAARASEEVVPRALGCG